MIAVPLLVASYLIGATPTSYIVGRWIHGVDLRTVGSGNLGATNAFRILGWKAALPVVVVDILKGWLPAAAFPVLLSAVAPIWAVAFGGAAVLGHAFSPWVGFRGGKGVATSAGVFLALAPGPVGVALVVWIGAMLLLRIVSVASMAAALVLPVSVRLLQPRDPWVLALSIALGGFVLWAHRGNMARLWSGTEPKIRGPRSAIMPPEEGTQRGRPR